MRTGTGYTTGSFRRVRCDLDVVNQREALRAGRLPGTATSHFHEIHAHGSDYDLEVDTSDSTPRDCAMQIMERLREPPSVLAELQRNRG